MDVFNLSAKISLDTSEYNNGLEDASKKTNSLGSKLSSGVTTVAKAGATALTMTTAAVGALAKQSLEGYANYEQLVGGVETLFGAGGKSIEEYAKSIGKTTDEVELQYASLMKAQNSVLADANNAYKDAGMSANEYMETVTGFSASLIQSLSGDTEAAAVIAKRAITDMSDNANKMGTDMSMIQNSYQGFAKQNFTINLMSAA